VVIPFIYNSASSFVGDYAAVSFEGRYGVVDKQGNVVIQFNYDWIKVFPNNTFAISSTGKWGLIDCDGSFIHYIEYGSIQYSGDSYVVEFENKSGFWDASGEEIIPYKYDHCFEWVYGADNCFIVNEGYGPQSHSIATLGEIMSSDLSHILLRNEITPRIRPYSQFLKEGFFETEAYEDGSPPFQESVGALNSFLHYYKLYKIDSGAPVMYYYTRPFQQSGFPRSYSGFYTVKDGQLNTLATGYECGGSMGGDCICFWQDSKTLEIYIGTYYHVGGFGGYAHGGNVYKHKNGTAVSIVSFDFIDQSARNYDESDLLKNAHLFYGVDDAAYSKATIFQAAEDHGYVTEYSVNDKRTTAQAYRETTDRYKMLILWRWNGY
jgi:hypothetical protein